MQAHEAVAGNPLVLWKMQVSLPRAADGIAVRVRREALAVHDGSCHRESNSELRITICCRLEHL